MAEETQKSNSNGCLIFAIVMLILIIGAILLGIFVYGGLGNNGAKNATMSDIDGNWTQSLLSNTFTFIPTKNIKGLVLQFDIYDSNYKLLNTVTKSIGNVKKGQQYTVTLTADEYWNGAQVKTTVKSGTISLF